MHHYFLKLDKKNWPPREGAYVLDGDAARIRLDYSVGTGSSITFAVGQDTHENKRTVLVNVPGLSVSAQVNSATLKPASSRRFSLSFDLDGWVHWNLGRDPDELFDSSPLHGVLNWKEAVLGSIEQSRVVTRTVRTTLSLPEGSYPCTVQLVDVTVWNKNLPRLTRTTERQCEVKFDEPCPPFPGKGENAYDLDQDCLMSHSGPGATVSEALAECFRFVMSRRERHGGLHWSPEPAPPANEPLPTTSGAQDEAIRLVAGILGARPELHRAGLVGMVLVKLPRIPEDAALKDASGYLLKLGEGIPGAAQFHVVFNVAGTLKQLTGFDTDRRLMPYDAFHLWPAPLPASAFAS